MEQRYNPTETTIEEDRDNQGRKWISGLASVFYDGTERTEYTLWNNKKRGKAVERIMPSAFDRALSEQQDAICCINHDKNQLLGRVSSQSLVLSKEDKGLRYKNVFDETDPDHQRAASKIKRGDLKGSSFRFQIVKEEWKQEGNTQVRYIQDVDLYDVGPVNDPAYSGTGLAGIRENNLVNDAEDSWEAYQTTIRFEKMKTLA